MLDLRRVRVFHEVAARRSFSAAADALGFTQPSVSHHISALERELGQRLINRGARPLSLTAAGELLQAAATVALAELDRAELGLQAIARGESGRVSLGSVITGLRGIVPPAVRAFRSRYPNVDIVLEERQPTEVLARLRSGQLDVGIVVVTRNGKEPDPDVFSAELLVEQHLVLAVSSRHRLARRETVRLNNLPDETWLLPSPERFPDFRAEIDGLLTSNGLSPRRIVEITDDIAAARLVAAGVGIGLAPQSDIALARGVALVPLSPIVTRRLLAVTIPGVHPRPVQALLDELRSAAAFHKAARTSGET